MPIHLKKKTFDQCFLPVLTNGCEKWTSKQQLTTKGAMERSMLGITRKVRERKESIRRKKEITDKVQRIK